MGIGHSSAAENINSNSSDKDYAAAFTGLFHIPSLRIEEKT